MTPSQKERIAAAAKELEAALNDADGYFSLDLHKVDVTPISSKNLKYIHCVSVTFCSAEKIA